MFLLYVVYVYCGMLKNIFHVLSSVLYCTSFLLKTIYYKIDNTSHHHVYSYSHVKHTNFHTKQITSS